MKKHIGILLILALLASLMTAALAETAGALAWRGYALEASWLTTDKADLNIPNLRDDGQFAMVRLEPAEGTIDYEVVNEHAGDDIFLRLANGEQVVLATVLYHRLITPEGGGFPSIDPQQDNFDALFFLEGGTEADLDGAALVIMDDGAEQVLALEAISRQKPE